MRVDLVKDQVTVYPREGSLEEVGELEEGIPTLVLADHAHVVVALRRDLDGAGVADDGSILERLGLDVVPHVVESHAVAGWEQRYDLVALATTAGGWVMLVVRVGNGIVKEWAGPVEGQGNDEERGGNATNIAPPSWCWSLLLD